MLRPIDLEVAVTVFHGPETPFREDSASRADALN